MTVKQFIKKANEFNLSILEKEVLNILEVADQNAEISNIDINELMEEHGAYAELVYYKDCYKFLQEEDITEYYDAIANGCNDLISITNYYLNENLAEAFQVMIGYVCRG